MTDDNERETALKALDWLLENYSQRTDGASAFVEKVLVARRYIEQQAGAVPEGWRYDLAAKAMHGMLCKGTGAYPRDLADQAYRYADAMLAAAPKPEGTHD